MIEEFHLEISQASGNHVAKEIAAAGGGSYPASRAEFTVTKGAPNDITEKLQVVADSISQVVPRIPLAGPGITAGERGESSAGGHTTAGGESGTVVLKADVEGTGLDSRRRLTQDQVG